MSDLETFLQDWNGFMDYKVTESDVKQPTEIFVRKCLLLLLKKMNIDTTNFETENETKDKLLKSKIRLCQVVDHFLKIYGVKKPFVYMNLINPTYKFTLHVLVRLLNYAIYIHMVNSETVDRIDEVLKERNDLMIAKNDLKKNIEWAKMNEEKYKKQIEELKKKIPNQKEQVKDLSQKDIKLSDEIQKIQEDCQKIEMNLMTIREEINDLNRLIVSDIEANSILESVENFKTHLKEHDQIIFAARKKNDKTSGRIKDLTYTVELIESIVNSFKIDLTELRNLKSVFNVLEKKVASLRQEIENSNPKLICFQTECENLSKESKDILAQIHKSKDNFEVEIKKLKKVKKEKQAILKKVQFEESSEIETKTKLAKQAEDLFVIISNTMMFINNC